MVSDIAILSGSERSASEDDTPGSDAALEWTLSAFEAALGDVRVCFVGAASVPDAAERRSDGAISRVSGPGSTGDVGALLSAPLTETTYVCTADAAVTPDVVDALEATAGDAVAVDPTAGETRADGDIAPAPSAADHGVATVETAAPSTDAPEALGAFAGVAKLSPERLDDARALVDEGELSERDSLAALCAALSRRGRGPRSIDASGRSATIETDDDLARFVLGTKAETLRRLRPILDRSRIKRPFSFTVAEWERSRDEVCDAVRALFEDEPVIVRSSARAEDGWERSHAGQFESVLDVPADDRAQLVDAVERVVASYDGNPDDQVLVQGMVDDTVHSGVVTTRTLESGSPYYVVNYDEGTSSTESVTDGTGEELRTTVVRKDALDDGRADLDRDGDSETPAFPLEKLLEAVREIETTIGCDRLDIEFAVSRDDGIYVLQVRPIPAESDDRDRSVADGAVYDAADAARESFADLQSAPPQVVGDRTIFSVMTDWNPAEIVGRRPRALADSLYRFLITDDVWARQRAEYGYRDVRPHPLLKSFAGQPYVDVRAVCNSFIPASVPDSVAATLCEHYLSRLERNPDLHDKVEFDVAITCLSFDFDRHRSRLAAAGLSDGEIDRFRDGLREITRTAYDRTAADYDRIDDLSERYRSLVEADLPPLRTARLLLEDCRQYGTLTFAHLARSAFVAVELLCSLERTGVLTADQRTAFLESLSTVAKELDRDAARVASGDLEWDAFVEEYGHLRPGTYEITSPSYGRRPDSYLRPLVDNADEPEPGYDPLSEWDEALIADVEDELASIGLPADVPAFVSFLKTAIEGREYAKFVFSRNLSAALEEIAAFGEERGLSREELSHVPISDLFRIADGGPRTDAAAWLRSRVEDGRRTRELASAVELPPLLTAESDFLAFDRPARDPTFVTDHTVSGEVVPIEDADVTELSLAGKIAIVPQADPGYDWLFGHDIAGFVTMYGGVNSHMAVRAAEFSIPAAIGVGESRYEDVRQLDRVELDCGGMRIRNR